MKVDDLSISVEQCEGRAPIAVARLAHRPGIDQISSARFQLQGDRLGLSNGAVFGAEAIGTVAVGEEPALQVGMAEEREGGSGCNERDQGVSEGYNIGVFIGRRAVNELNLREVLKRKRALRQSVQPSVMFRSQLVARPDSGGGGHRVEVVKLEQAGRSLVMIAADENLSQTARAIDHFIGGSSIAHHVAEVRHKIERWGRREGSLQRFEVGVNVAEQQYAQ